MALTETTQLNSLPLYLAALVVEEFPQLLGTPRALECEHSHLSHQHEARFTCSKLVEDANEEGLLDEDRARRNFQQSLESLRRCTQVRRRLTYQDSTGTNGSVDSIDLESA